MVAQTIQNRSTAYTAAASGATGIGSEADNTLAANMFAIRRDGATGLFIDYNVAGTIYTKTLGATGVITISKSITIPDPTNAENISMFFSDEALTVTKMAAVLVGSTGPSVTWTIRKSASRAATGVEVVTGGTTTTSTTTGSVVTSFNSATIAANDYVWLQTSAKAGTVTQLNITVIASKS